MATRTFCDHCGNTVRNPQRFEFGPKRPTIEYEKDLAYAMAKAQGFGQAMPAILPQAIQAGNIAQPTHPTKVVDLCDTCVPIWYERVDKLCRASDPKEGD